MMILHKLNNIYICCFFLISTLYSLPCCLHELFGSNVEIIMREEVGVACLGQNNSRKDIREEALLDAKKQAVKNAVMEIKSKQKIINGILVIDLIEAYTNAKVIIKNILKEESFIEENKAFKDECYRVRVLAKIIPKDYNEFKINNLDKKKYPGKIRIDECTYHNCTDWLFTFDECNSYNHWRIPTSKEYNELYELYHVKHINKHRVFWTSDKITDNSNKAIAFNLEKGTFYAYKNKRFYILYICDK
ncbi:hypothetical protein MHK_005423 [Candidatus Magnetomorum sp. HK-1]|nr:hypothetical protein MHK_005423 [Candidatus Magnetomorum sp. HK-1]